MDIILADLVVDNKSIKAILHAPKNGFFYVLNRETGKLVSAEPFTKMTWASHVDLETGRPVELPDARYEDGEANIWPSAHGAHSWQSMSYNPETGLVYLPTMNMGGRYVDLGQDTSWRATDFIGGTGVGMYETLLDDNLSPGMLQAWDPVKQSAVWQVKQEHPWNAGTLTTAGNLVFQGSHNGRLYAFDATTGEEVWNYNLGLGISAPPITYKIDGTQYLSILIGYGGGYTVAKTPGLPDEGWAYGLQTRRLVTFSLGGDTTMPKQPEPHFPQPIVDSDFIVDEEIATLGSKIYGPNCGICHGGAAEANAMAPDLRASPIPLSFDAFSHVVRDGGLADRGMPPFSALTVEELKGLQHYIRYFAHRAAQSK